MRRRLNGFPHTLLIVFASFIVSSSQTASAQITTPRVLSAVPDRFANLEEQLVNRLKATTRERRGYLNFVVNQVRIGKLDSRIVVAIERYARRRNPEFPFPFFERALRFESAKRGIALPKVQQFASTRIVND